MARALDLHSRGQGFDPLILHKKEDGSPKSEVRRRCFKMDIGKMPETAKTFTEIMRTVQSSEFKVQS